MKEKELIHKAQTGNEEAFAALVEKYRVKMFNLAYSLIRNQETADDMAQDIFIKAYVSLPKFQHKSEFGTWLYRIAVNTIKDHLKKESRAKMIPFDENLAGHTPRVDELTKREKEQEKVDRKQNLYAAIRSLPEKHRIILTLRDIQGFPYGEIVKILNISPGTVDSRLHRARKMLRKKWIASQPQGGKYEMQKN